jgi:hypothetical protein
MPNPTVGRGGKGSANASLRPTPKSADTGAVPSAAFTPPALNDLESICEDLFARWDTDMRAGKLLTALSGNMPPGYDPRVDHVRLALDAFPAMLAALKPFADASEHLHPSTPDDGVTLDGIAVRHWRAAWAAIAKALGAEAASPAIGPSHRLDEPSQTEGA